MEKQVLNVSYKSSGVKTLNGFGVFFFVVGIISLLIAVIGGFVYLGNSDSYSGAETALVGASLAGTFFPIGILLLFAGAVCAGLSGIAKTALYKRTILEQQYDFKEAVIKQMRKNDVSKENGESKKERKWYE
jgi:hypothetical protein